MMKVRFNPLESYLFVIHQVSFSCSPIEKNRFREELRLRIQEDEYLRKASKEAQPTEELLDYRTESDDWWWKLAHPFELATLIKRYHLVDNWFFAIFFGHFLLLSHFVIKSLVHTFYTGKDPERIKYFNSIYYPHIIGVLPESYLFSNLFLALSVFYLSMRLLSAYHLIKNSIINEHGYKKISFSQINFTVFTLFELNLEQWIKLFKHTWKHETEVQKDPLAWEAHLDFKMIIHQQYDKLCRNDLMFHLNVIDFEECYQELDIWRTSKRKKRYQLWHCATPLMRFNTSIILRGLFITYIGSISASIGYIILVFGMIYLELRDAFPPDQVVGLGEVLSNWRSHLSNPLHSVRLFEMFLLSILQLPQQYDCILAILDKTTLIARASKLNQVIQHDLKLCDHWKQSDKQSFTHLNYANQSADENEPGLNRPIYNSQSEPLLGTKAIADKRRRLNEIEELNLKIQHHARLISMLYSEFLNIRRAHSALLNLVIGGNGILMTYTIALLFTAQGTVQLIILLSCFVAFFVPTIDALIFCAVIERSFKNLYRSIGHLLVNKRGLLNTRTSKILIAVGEPFESKEDRSFLVAGIYAITLDSVAPVSKLRYCCAADNNVQCYYSMLSIN